MTDGTTVYFLINVYADGTTDRYGIEDCGTKGDFSSCVQKDGSQAIFPVASGEGIEETNYGCTTQVLGSNPDPVDFGNNNWGMVANDGSSWDVRKWVGSGTGCGSDYKYVISGDIVDMWDSRNTS